MTEEQSRQKSYVYMRSRDLSFDIMENVGLVAFKVALPDYFGEVHDVFHVSSLKKSFGQREPHFVDPEHIQLQPNLTYEVAPTQIVDWKEQRLRSKTISLVKVSWDFDADDAEGELKDSAPPEE
ncbi:uncharacterized protein LOC121242384 [Juglans microcarpa x Juglans regia]|uniref:uncharacterized protein LOC121242384 n=1 Tax=Juglans microcarpa x Juglans regia TaxID=2249226 RepID=UPI001B7EBB50|nr:uncharacterized protein LOC121242384 [Juglans microcarpa x Juglans regia]